MSYEKIKQYVLDKHNRVVKDCWIAHVKELNGLPVRVAPNRGEVRMVECPTLMRPRIEEAMKYLGMLCVFLSLAGCVTVKPKPPLQTGSSVAPVPACVELRKHGGSC